MDDKKKKEYKEPEAEVIVFENELDTLVDSGTGDWTAGKTEGWWGD